VISELIPPSKAAIRTDPPGQLDAQMQAIPAFRPPSLGIYSGLYCAGKVTGIVSGPRLAVTGLSTRSGLWEALGDLRSIAGSDRNAECPYRCMEGAFSNSTDDTLNLC